MKVAVLLILLSATTTTIASTLDEDLTAISLVIEQLKEEEKAASKEFHDKLSDAIGANIVKIKENIKGAIAKFDETHDPAVLKKAKDEFIKKLTTGISQLAQLKKEINEKKAEAWEANKDKIEQTIADVATVVTAARQELTAKAEVAPKDLNSALNRLTRSSSWETASWLLMLLAVLLIGIIAIMVVKTMKGAGYNKIGGNNVFVPSRNV